MRMFFLLVYYFNDNLYNQGYNLTQELIYGRKQTIAAVGRRNA